MVSTGDLLPLTSYTFLSTPHKQYVAQVVKPSLNSEVIGISCVFVPFQFELEFNFR